MTVRLDASSADAVLTKAVAASTAYTITVECYMPASTLAALTDASDGGTASLLTPGSYAGFTGGIGGALDVSTWKFAVTAGPIGLMPINTWFTIEADITHVSGSTWDVDWLIDGAALVTDTGETYINDETQPLYFTLGGRDAFHVAGEVYYFRNLLVKDAADATIFTADLATDASGFDATTGAVTFVSDPTTIAGVLVAYGDDALEPVPTWTRIDSVDGIDVVTGWSVRRGRSYTSDKMDAGTATVSFVDTTGVLDPTNADGPFFPMDPNCPGMICLFNPVSENWVPIFTGLLQSCPQQINMDSVANRGTLEFADLFSLLAIAEVPPGLDFSDNEDGTYTPISNITGNTKYPESTVQDRIKAVLADASIPVDLTTIFSGNVRCQTTTYSPGEKILTAIQDAADAEFPGVANIYVSKDGVITFHGRLARFDPFGGSPSYGIQSWDVGDAAAVAADTSMASLASLTLDRDVTKVVNNALFTPQGIDAGDISGQIVTDSGSITKYGQRGLTGTDLINAGATAGPNAGQPLAETLMFSQFYADNFHTAQTRVGQATFRWRNPDASNAAAHWSFLCGVELNDIVNITTTHPGGGGFTDASYFVEGISYDRGLGPELTLTLDLSSADYYFVDGVIGGTSLQPDHWDQT